MISRPRGICLLHVYVAIGWLHYQQSDYQRRSLSPTLEKARGAPLSLATGTHLLACRQAVAVDSTPR
jgi:hypothetical protein